MGCRTWGHMDSDMTEGTKHLAGMSIVFFDLHKNGLVSFYHFIEWDCNTSNNKPLYVLRTLSVLVLYIYYLI